MFLNLLKLLTILFYLLVRTLLSPLLNNYSINN
nr:MAG TPA: hypothetical protein [Caudoviricetes sp.]